MIKFKISTVTTIALYAMLAVVFSSCSQGLSKCENPNGNELIDERILIGFYVILYSLIIIGICMHIPTVNKSNRK